jgi:hypothetical protein
MSTNLNDHQGEGLLYTSIMRTRIIRDMLCDVTCDQHPPLLGGVELHETTTHLGEER